MKRRLTILLITLLLLAGGSAHAEEPIKVGLLLDSGGLDDHAFNQSAWTGLQRAQNELGIDIGYKQFTKGDDYRENLTEMIKEGYTLIIGAGFMLKEALEEVAPKHPEVKFAGIDIVFDEPVENLLGAAYKDHEIGFLAGFVASSMTEVGAVGFLGGMDIPPQQAFEWGYRAGVMRANPEVKVEAVYAGSFSDVEKGYELATKMYEDQDIIFFCGGEMGTGGIYAAVELNKKCIGVDIDQSYLAPEHVLTSAMKYVNNTTLEICRDMVAGAFEGGNIQRGLESGSVGLSDNVSGLLSEELMQAVAAVEEKIVAGAIDVPASEEEARQMGYQQ